MPGLVVPFILKLNTALSNIYYYSLGLKMQKTAILGGKMEKNWSRSAQSWKYTISMNNSERLHSTSRWCSGREEWRDAAPQDFAPFYKL